MTTTTPTTSSTSKAMASWPADAVPEHWIDALFEKMARMWGNSFLDKWRDVDMKGVKTEWAKGLQRLSRAELKAGVDSLLTLKYSPSLPEFYSLCRQQRLYTSTTAASVTDQTRASPAVVSENIKRMREIMAPLQAKIVGREST